MSNSTPSEKTIEDRYTPEEVAFAILVNCLVSVGQQLNKNELFQNDLWYAAELIGLSKLDLLRIVTELNKRSGVL